MPPEPPPELVVQVDQSEPPPLDDPLYRDGFEPL